MKLGGDYSFGSANWPGLSKLIEECGEVQQIAGKLMQVGGDSDHWSESDLRQRMQDELGDLMAAVSIFVETSGLDKQAIWSRANEKHDLFEKWHREQGGANR